MARRGTRFLCLFPMSVRMVGLDATCDASHVPVAGVAAGDGENCLKFRSDEVQERNKLRSQATTGRAALPVV